MTERPGLSNWFKVRFIAGIFVTLPAFVTAWILWMFWSKIDDLFTPMYLQLFGRVVPGLGFLTAVAIILIMGAIARNVVGRRVLAWGEMVLLKVPVFRTLYPSIKMFVDAFSPERRGAFRAVVLVQHPREGAWAFGFVTSELSLDVPGGNGQDTVGGDGQMVTVFVPTNNLYLGDIIVVPRHDVLFTGLTVEEGLRVILSAGTATPQRLPRSFVSSEYPPRR